MGDIPLTGKQVTEMTGIPYNSILTMAQKGMIMSIENEKSGRRTYPLSSVDNVRAQYEVFKAQTAENRSAAQKARFERTTGVEERVAKLEQQLYRMAEALEFNLDEPEPED